MRGNFWAKMHDLPGMNFLGTLSESLPMVVGREDKIENLAWALDYQSLRASLCTPISSGLDVYRKFMLLAGSWSRMESDSNGPRIVHRMPLVGRITIQGWSQFADGGELSHNLCSRRQLRSKAGYYCSPICVYDPTKNRRWSLSNLIHFNWHLRPARWIKWRKPKIENGLSAFRLSWR